MEDILERLTRCGVGPSHDDMALHEARVLCLEAASEIKELRKTEERYEMRWRDAAAGAMAELQAKCTPPAFTSLWRENERLRAEIARLRADLCPPAHPESPLQRAFESMPPVRR